MPTRSRTPLMDSFTWGLPNGFFKALLKLYHSLTCPTKSSFLQALDGGLMTHSLLRRPLYFSHRHFSLINLLHDQFHLDVCFLKALNRYRGWEEKARAISLSSSLLGHRLEAPIRLHSSNSCRLFWVLVTPQSTCSFRPRVGNSFFLLPTLDASPPL